MISDGRFAKIGALVGLMTTAGLVGWLNLLHWTLRIPFVPLSIGDTIIGLTPGAFATVAIDLLGPWAMRLLQMLSIGIMLCIGAGLGAWVASCVAPDRGKASDDTRRLRSSRPFRIATLAGVAMTATIVVEARVGWGPAPPVLTLAVLAASILSWAGLTDWAIGRWARLGAMMAPSAENRRRRFLWQIAAATSAIAIGGVLAGQRLRPQPQQLELPPASQTPSFPPAETLSTSAPETTAALSTPLPTSSLAATSAEAAATVSAAPAGLLPQTNLSEPLAPGTPLPAFEPAPGTRPNVTPIEDFYVVDIAATDPLADLNQWRLAVKGLVDRPLSLTFDDLLALPRVDVYATLQCISDKIGGRDIGTALFSGVRLRDVLDKAGSQRTVIEVVLRSLDNYSESLPIDKALHEDTLLVYGMDGKTLAQGHGFPLRLYNPDHYGMKSPKWLKEVELVSEPYDGYWERSGWSKEATVQTTSVFDSPGQAKVENGVVRLGGIAFAGWRGIQEVGVQIDSGDFRPAVLDQPLGKSSWVRWRFDWQAPEPGTHRITVRAIDGLDDEQTDAVAPPHPEGATGRHRVLIVI